MTEKPVVYGYYRSSAATRLRIALIWKGIDYEHIPIDLATHENLSDDYGKVNPSKKIPTFITKEGKTLTQSVAILEYLEEAYPDSRRLLPSTPLARAHARELMMEVAADIHPIQNPSVANDAAGGDADKRTAWMVKYISKGFKGLEAKMQTTAGKYSVGDEVSLADVCLAPQYYNAQRFNVDLEPYPTIRKVMANLHELPEFIKAHPLNQDETPAELKGKF